MSNFVSHFHLSGWGIYWLVWFVGGFGIAETFGLIHNTKDTLSWQFWGLEKVDFGHPLDFAEWNPIHWIIALVILAFVSWLAGHLVFGIWR